MRFVIAMIFACGVLFSAPLKILSIKNSADEVRVIFNQNITQKNFTHTALKNGAFYDIRAELTIPKKSIKLANGANIVIAQNTKKITRIVIESKKIANLLFKIDKKTLILRFKNDESLSELFANLDVKKSKKGAESSVDSTKKPADSTKKPADSAKKGAESSVDSTKKGADSSADSTKKPVDSTKKPADSTKATINIAHNKIIVLDAGHGGKDCGAKVGKICEKTLVLNISKKAEQILKTRGYKVFVTRGTDKYLSLTERTKFANDKNADIFISIHANAIDKKAKNYSTANGIETYFLSTARSERARKVAELENKDDIEVMNHFSKLSFLNSINSQRLLASNKLAIDVQSGMLINARKLYNKTLDGGVREGPFWVLAGALMPSILIEVGYMTNATDLKRLQSKDYQNALAKGIADGIDGYFAKNF